jgi:hypothetical protein
MSPKGTRPDSEKLERVVAEARRERERRERGYREQALKIYPWICGRCGREFSGANLRMLTVHHRDHDHDNNPPDGSNWELLCLYCHDNEHARQLELAQRGGAGTSGGGAQPATHKPFAALESLLKSKK